MDNKENDKIEQPETQKKEKEKDKKKYLVTIVFILAVCNILVYISNLTLRLPNFFREITNSCTFSTKFYHSCHF